MTDPIHPGPRRRAAGPDSRLVPLLLTATLAFPGGPLPAQEAPPPEGGAQVPAAGADDPGRYGVLVMAHGGTPEWNQAVLEATEPLAEEVPLEVAFGMADACSLQEAVARLEAEGVRRVGVVRLFVSGESWYERTEQILGLSPGAPAEEIAEQACGEASEGEGHHHHLGAYFRLDTRSTFALSAEGLAQAPEMGPVLADRARALSRDPATEEVLVLAHGPGDEAENARWLDQLDLQAAAIRAALPFHRVEVQTLREDWPDKRKEAEEWVRAFVDRAATAGHRTLVIPFRVFGFGPYEKVLDGGEYVADGVGLLPHSNVGLWISRQAEGLAAGPFRPPQDQQAQIAGGD